MLEAIKHCKVAFFDIDGTLSIPKYFINKKIVIGTSTEEWHKFNIITDHSYKDCLIPTSEKLYKLLDYCKENNIELKILTAEANGLAYFSKVDFILENYTKYFKERDIIFVGKSADKVPFLQMYAECKNLKIDEIFFMDDNFDICLEAQTKNITVYHNSYLY